MVIIEDLSKWARWINDSSGCFVLGTCTTCWLFSVLVLLALYNVVNYNSYYSHNEQAVACLNCNTWTVVWLIFQWIQFHKASSAWFKLSYHGNLCWETNLVLTRLIVRLSLSCPLTMPLTWKKIYNWLYYTTSLISIKNIVCVALHFFASGTLLYTVGNAENIGKATVCHF